MSQEMSSARDAKSMKEQAHGQPEEHSSGRQGVVPGRDFIDALLAALAQMAALSPRRQADVAVAMRRAGLACPPDWVPAALDRLRQDGCIDKPLHLSDGGILVSMTVRGIERLAATSHRHVVAGLMAGSPG